MLVWFNFQTKQAKNRFNNIVKITHEHSETHRFQHICLIVLKKWPELECPSLSGAECMFGNRFYFIISDISF